MSNNDSTSFPVDPRSSMIQSNKLLDNCKRHLFYFIVFQQYLTTVPLSSTKTTTTFFSGSNTPSSSKYGSLALKMTTYVASRVQQLDAEVLEGELDSLFVHQLKKTLSFLDMFAPKVVSAIQPELELMIKFYIFKHSLWTRDATLGQELLNLKLVNKDDSMQSLPLTRNQKTGLGFLEVLVPYLSERFGSVLSSIPKLQTRIEDTLRALNLLNFLIFLTNGRYRSLSHRVLGVSCSLKDAASIFSPVNYDYMSREILWFAFAEFASFILPLINIVKIKNYLTRMVRGKPNPTLCATSMSERSRSDLLACAVCNQSPVNTREIGCNHCFCYYCVTVSILSDTKHGFVCPKCNHSVKNLENVKEVYLKGF